LRLKLLEQLMRDEIQRRQRKNLAQAKSFQELLEATLRKYHNRLIDAAAVIQALLEIVDRRRRPAGEGTGPRTGRTGLLRCDRGPLRDDLRAGLPLRPGPRRGSDAEEEPEGGLDGPAPPAGPVATAGGREAHPTAARG